MTEMLYYELHIFLPIELDDGRPSRDLLPKLAVAEELFA